jgi:hypothetical protein
MSIISSNITSAGQTVYTSSGNSVITWASITNWRAANITANVHVVALGNSVSNINMIVSNVLITSGDTYQIYTGNEKLVLGNGDFMYIISNANAMASTVSYTSA